MAIRFACKCGKMLTVPDTAVGLQARCPACDAVVRVPGTYVPKAVAPDERPATKMDQVVDAFAADLEKSRKRAPQLTEIAIGFLIWSGVSVLLTFLASLLSDAQHSLVFWVTVYVPMSAAGALLALGVIKAWRWTPEGVLTIAPLMVGANYVLFWLWAGNVVGWGVLFFLVSIINVGSYGFLYWYFRWEGGSAVFELEETAAAEGGENKSKPAEGTQEK